MKVVFELFLNSNKGVLLINVLVGVSLVGGGR